MIVLTSVSLVVVVAGGWSLWRIWSELSVSPLPYRWEQQIAVFVGVTTLPQFVIAIVAICAETVARDLPRRKVREPWFRNLGAWVGLAERPLYFGALVAGRAEFVAAWLVFKSIAGYRVGLQDEQLKERRLFQLFLLNNAMSLGGVAAGWLVWKLLRLPTY